MTQTTSTELPLGRTHDMEATLKMGGMSTMRTGKYCTNATYLPVPKKATCTKNRKNSAIRASSAWKQ